jgi:hypothetical protein
VGRARRDIVCEASLSPARFARHNSRISQPRPAARARTLALGLLLLFLLLALGGGLCSGERGGEKGARVVAVEVRRLQSGERTGFSVHAQPA